MIVKKDFMAMLSHSGHTLLMLVYIKTKHANNHLLRFSHVIYAITSPVLPLLLRLGMILNLLFLNRVFISLDTQTQQMFQNDFSFIIQQTTKTFLMLYVWREQNGQH